MSDKNEIIIIGAGGHGKVVLSTLLSMGKKVRGFVDDNPNLLHTKILGYPVLGNRSLLIEKNQAAILTIGDNQIRKKFAAMYPHLNWQTAIHPTAYVHESVTIGQGSVVFAGAIIQPDSMIGEHTIINTAVSIDHDCRIENFTHLAPGVHLAGHVTLGEGCFLGMNSCVIPTQSVGAWSTIGAGSVVVKNIDANVFAKGVPARIYKKRIACGTE